jgi:DNA-binding transcriptional ArsR family regulator
MHHKPAEDDLMEQARRALHQTIARTGRHDHSADAGKVIKDPARRHRSYRTCWLPAKQTPLRASPRDGGAYVPELSARIEDDRNLTDGARRCARKLAEYTYRRDRDSRTAQITVTYLMKALGKSRRTVQRYLRQLERAGYITAAVIHAGTRMCAGLMVELLFPLIPRHGWPQKLIKPDAPKVSQNNSSRYKTRLISRVLWAVKCTDPIQTAWDHLMPPLIPVF